MQHVAPRENMTVATISQHEPAQRKLVHKLIQWERIESRRECYPAIKEAFPLTTLKERSESPPYYCHYMSWRLGTWEDESLFQRLEKLLCCAAALPDWKHEQSILRSGDFAEFWSLIWQLQVAEYLCEVGTDVRWAKSGPDLNVKVDGTRWYVECYTPRKSFGLLRFLEELLQKLYCDVRISYDLCKPFSLPGNSGRREFLDKILRRFLDPNYLAKPRSDAETKHQVVLYKDPNSSSLHIYVEGANDACTPDIIVPKLTGDPKSYVECVLEEAVNAKMCSNCLKHCHPNLVAVNLLNDDFQMAVMLPYRLQSLTLPQIAPNIDALAVSTVGIDKRLTRNDLKVIRDSSGSSSSSLDRIASHAQ